MSLNEPSNLKYYDPSSLSKKGKLIFIVLIFVLVLLGIFYFGQESSRYLADFAKWVENLGFWGPLIFILGYALATIAFIPGSILTLASGAIFGIGKGTIYVFFAATCGASLAFLFSRYLGRKRIEKKLRGNIFLKVRINA